MAILNFENLTKSWGGCQQWPISSGYEIWQKCA